MTKIEKEADKYAKKFSPWLYSTLVECFKKGAEWQKEQFEKERLKHCDTLTKEEYEMESEFVMKHLENNNRIPTFCDAIEYGMKLQKEQMIDKACEFLETYPHMFMGILRSEMIDDFRKAMEEEK